LRTPSSSSRPRTNLPALSPACIGEAKALDKGLHRILDRLRKVLEKDPPPGERREALEGVIKN